MKKLWRLSMLLFFCNTAILCMMPPSKSKPIEKEKLIEALVLALQYGNYTKASALIKILDPKIHDVNTRDPKTDNSLLHLLAAQQRKYENQVVLWVKKFLQNGAMVNVQNKDGNTPLHYATGHGNLRIAFWLMEYGADRLLTNRMQETALHLLCSNEALIKDMNYKLHGCERAPDTLGCKHAVLSNFQLLATAPEDKNHYIPSLYSMCIKFLAYLPSSALKVLLPCLSGRVKIEKELQYRYPHLPKQQPVETIQDNIIIEHMRVPDLASTPLVLIDSLSTERLLKIRDEIYCENSLRPLLINAREEKGKTALHLLAQSGACQDIMRMMIGLGAARMIRAQDPQALPHELFCFVRCQCADNQSFPNTKKLLMAPASLAAELAQKIKDRKIAESERLPSPTSAIITPRSEVTAPSPRV